MRKCRKMLNESDKYLKEQFEKDGELKWDMRYLKLAKEVSTWSKDPSTKVGAVIVRPDKSLCSVGFNGFAQGVDDSPERYNNRELKYKLIVHGEINAREFAREPVHGYTLYTYPFMPCERCAGPMIQAGIKTIISLVNDNPRWDFTYSKQQFGESGREVLLYEPDLFEKYCSLVGV